MQATLTATVVGTTHLVAESAKITVDGLVTPAPEAIQPPKRHTEPAGGLAARLVARPERLVRATKFLPGATPTPRKISMEVNSRSRSAADRACLRLKMDHITLWKSDDGKSWTKVATSDGSTTSWFFHKRCPPLCFFSNVMNSTGDVSTCEGRSFFRRSSNRTFTPLLCYEYVCYM